MFGRKGLGGAFLLVVAFWSANLVFGDNLSKTISFTRNDLSFSLSNGYDVVNLRSGLSMREVSKPMLPFRKLNYIIPASVRVQSFNLIPTDSLVLPGEFLIYPAQPPLKSGGDSIPPFIPPDSETYHSPNPYPSKLIDIFGDGYTKEAHIVAVDVYPVHWIPSTRKLVLYTRLALTLTLVSSSNGSLVARRRSDISQFDFETYLTKFVANPEDIGRYLEKPGKIEKTGKTVKKLVITSLPSIEGSMVDYVIITSRACSTAFGPIADWKTQKGIPTVIKTTEWISDTYHGCDLAEKIRNFIKDAYTYWGTSWVLLGGDVEIIPARFVQQSEIPVSDLYYADLQGNWDLNSNGLFGEPGDFEDPYALWDIAVGRCPAHTSTDVNTFWNKLNAYERIDPSMMQYVGKILLLGADPYQTCDGPYYKDQIRAISGIPSLWRKWRLYSVNCTAYQRDGDLNLQNTKDEINAGYNLINHIDHATAYTLGIDCDDFHTVLQRSDIDALSGTWKSAIFYTLGCWPAAIDADCIAERFVRNPNGGGVAFIGNSRDGDFGEGGRSDMGLFSAIFDTCVYRLGLAVEHARQHEFWGEYFQIILLGDPEMPIWTDNPQNLVVLYPSSIPMGEQQFTVTVSCGGNPVAEALVCLEKRNLTTNEIEAYASALTDQYTGQATFTYTPETPGDFYVTVTGRNPSDHNFKPFEGTCNVTNQPNSPYVFPIRGSRNYIDSPGGNGDGEPNPGESMGLTLELQNSGGATANNVHAEISIMPPDPWVSVTKSGANFGNIAAGQKVRNTSDPFTISISSGCGDVYNRPIDVQVTADPSYSWHDKFTIVVLGDSLKFIGHSRGGEVLGQQYTLTALAIVNRGSGAGAGVVATLLANPDSVSIEPPGTAQFGQINANSTVVSTDPFVYTVLKAPSSGNHLGFRIRMDDAYAGREWIKRFEVDPPHPPPSAPSLSASQTTINLMWMPPTSDFDVYGYNVYRSNYPGGPYSRINPALVESTTYYQDTGLNPTTTYYYVITTVDTSLNESDYSAEAHATTNYNYMSNWPQLVLGDGVNYSSPVAGTIYPPGPNIPLGRQIVIGGGDSKVHAWFSNGWDVIGYWPVSVSGPVRTTPALGDLNGVGNDEVVVAVKTPTGGTDIYVWDGSGSPLANWPKHISDEIEDATVPVLADIDGDGSLDILLGTRTQTNTGNVWAWNGLTGNAIYGWPPALKPDCSVRGIVVGNAQGDWHNEVYAAASTGGGSGEHATIYGWNYQGTKLTGWPHNSPTHVFGSLALGDFDKDGNLEVVGVQDTLDVLKLVAWSGAGTRKKMTDLGIGLSNDSPSLGDIRNTGYLDVFFSDSWSGKLGAWDYQWSPLYQFTKNLGSWIWGSPILGGGDVLVGHAWRVYGYDNLGNDLSGWPLQENGECTITPCITDLDGDGRTDLISATEDGWVYVWPLGTVYDKERQDWPMSRHDRWHTGRYSQVVSGNLPGNTTWEGNIELKGNVTVLSGQTLTIKPGTVIKFRGAYRLIVNANATLNAIGTSLDSIYFTSSKPNPAPNDWTGIDVSGTANLQFCAVRYGNNNLTGQTSSILNVSYSRFTNAAAAGIVLRRGPHNVSYCDISNNNLFGINVWGAWANGVNATIQNNTLAQNQKYGIYAHFNINSGTVSVNSNTISYMWMPPVNPSLDGIKCDTVTNVVKLYANNISGYGQDGINMLRSSPKCTCNVISSINNNGLYFYNGSSVVTHNFVDAVNIGAYVTGPGTSTTVPNLGNGVAGSDGLNGIVGYTWRGLNTLGTQVKAQNNWWGGYPPDPAWFSGSWDYSRPLQSAPGSCAGGGGPQMGELLEQQLPRVFALAQSRPNPSTGELVIHYQLPKASDVSIKVFNVSGQLVKTLVKGPQKAGYYAASWKGRDETGHAVRSGVYFYKMEAGEFKAIRKLVIVR